MRIERTVTDGAQALDADIYADDGQLIVRVRVTSTPDIANDDRPGQIWSGKYLVTLLDAAGDALATTEIRRE